MKIEAYMNVDPQGGAIFFRTNVSHVATIPLVAAYELAAAQAREAKLREIFADLDEYFELGTVGSEIVRKALSIPTNTEALDERLRQAKVEVLRRVEGMCCAFDARLINGMADEIEKGERE